VGVYVNVLAQKPRNLESRKGKSEGVYLGRFFFFCFYIPSAYGLQLKHLYINYRSRDSVVGKAIGYGLDDREVAVRVLVG
jgi:hypothetical protein